MCINACACTRVVRVCIYIYMYVRAFVHVCFCMLCVYLHVLHVYAPVLRCTCICIYVNMYMYVGHACFQVRYLLLKDEDLLAEADARPLGGTVFGYRVADPERYGVVDFAPDGSVRAIIEKPAKPPSHFAAKTCSSHSCRGTDTTSRMPS